MSIQDSRVIVLGIFLTFVYIIFYETSPNKILALSV